MHGTARSCVQPEIKWPLLFFSRGTSALMTQTFVILVVPLWAAGHVGVGTPALAITWPWADHSPIAPAARAGPSLAGIRVALTGPSLPLKETRHAH